MADDQRPVIRVSDAERQDVVAALREAVGAGRITLEEFGDRTGLALAAMTSDDLAALSQDLPVPSPEVASPGKVTRWMLACARSRRRSGAPSG